MTAVNITGATSAVLGTSIELTGAATGTPDGTDPDKSTWQWKMQKPVEDAFQDIAGATTATFSVTVAKEHNGAKVTVGYTAKQTDGTAIGQEVEATQVVLAVTAAAPEVGPISPATPRELEGNTATLNVPSPAAGVTLQWKKQAKSASVFTPIAGATSATYTTDPVTTDDDGAQFLVEATAQVEGLGTSTSVSSEPVTLEVKPDKARIAIFSATFATLLGLGLLVVLALFIGSMIWFYNEYLTDADTTATWSIVTALGLLISGVIALLLAGYVTLLELRGRARSHDDLSKIGALEEKKQKAAEERRKARLEERQAESAAPGDGEVLLEGITDGQVAVGTTSEGADLTDAADMASAATPWKDLVGKSPDIIKAFGRLSAAAAMLLVAVIVFGAAMWLSFGATDPDGGDTPETTVPETTVPETTAPPTTG